MTIVGSQYCPVLEVNIQTSRHIITVQAVFLSKVLPVKTQTSLCICPQISLCCAWRYLPLLFQSFAIHRIPSAIHRIPSAIHRIPSEDWLRLGRWEEYTKCSTVFTPYICGNNKCPDQTAPNGVGWWRPIQLAYLDKSPSSYLFKFYDKAVSYGVQILTHCSLKTPKRITGKQCRPRPDAASDQSLHCLHIVTIFLLEYLNHTAWHP